MRFVILGAIATFTLSLLGCQHERTDEGLDYGLSVPEAFLTLPPYNVEQVNDLQVRPVAFYVAKIGDSSFKWPGPTSSEPVIPVDHALRALSFIGDAAVPSILELMTDSQSYSDRIGIYCALSAIGLPVSQHKEILEGDVQGIRLWWSLYKDRSIQDRTAIRNAIGLPPPNLYDIDGNFREQSGLIR